MNSSSFGVAKHADISHWVPLSKMDTGVWADTKVQVTSDLYVLVPPSQTNQDSALPSSSCPCS